MDNLGLIFFIALFAFSAWQWDKLETLKKQKKPYSETNHQLYQAFMLIALGGCIALGYGILY